MKNTASKRIIASFLLLFCIAVLTAIAPTTTIAAQLAAADYFQPIAPGEDQLKAGKLIVDQLMYKHYRQLDFDDELSVKIFNRYLSDLDSNHNYFCAADIREFEEYRLQLDDMLKSGDLSPAYRIFNRYQERLVERLVNLLNRLDGELQTLDFAADDYFDTDRENAPWAACGAELDGIWHQRLKATVLELKLAGKSMAEIEETLTRRFRNQLTQAGRMRSEDAFQAYMNSVSALFDPHTQYLSPRSSENFSINMKLSLEGIGAILRMEDEYVQVVRLVPGGPADKGRQLKATDRIVGVGQGDTGEMIDVIGWRLDEVVQLIRGPKGTVVRLEILPAEGKNKSATRREINIVRNTVNLEEQSAQKKILNVERGGTMHKIGVILLPAFYADLGAMQTSGSDYRSTTSDVRRLLQELTEAGVEGVVIDLRDNGGGSLHEANMLTGLFIKRGPTVQIRSTSGRIDVLKDPDPEIVYEGPLVVLVNRLSASASEIFAGAIQDYGRGLIIGEPTFGKGTVQSLRSLNHGQLKITSAKFYRISGESTQHKGITPDFSYPSLYDSEEIGESALEDALPWDKIRAASYNQYSEALPALIPQLADRHANRLQSDPYYRYLNERRARLQEVRKQTRLSLREEERRLERGQDEEWRLAVENRLRAARKQPPLKSIGDLESEEEDKHLLRPHMDENDPLFIESSQVLLDLLDFSGQTAARHQ